MQSTGQMQCKVYDSMLALSSDLQAARALTIISIVIGILGIMLAMAGGKCTNCIEDESSKTKVGITAGVIFIIAVCCVWSPCAGRPTSSSRTSTTPWWTKHRRESWEQRFTSAGEPLRCWSSGELCSAATAHQRRKQENTQTNITLHLGLKLLHHPARKWNELWNELYSALMFTVSVWPCSGSKEFATGSWGLEKQSMNVDVTSFLQIFYI